MDELNTIFTINFQLFTLCSFIVYNTKNIGASDIPTLELVVWYWNQTLIIGENEMNQVTLMLVVFAFAQSNIASAKSDETIGGNQAMPNQAMSEIQQIKQQMAEMERRHDAEIAALRNENGDKWLTQQRADEIREVVKDVLADS